jgi:RNA polymerase sigma-70 factor (ECF subfamily)
LQEIGDILQNIFLKLYLSGTEFEGRATVNTWLYRITVNECINHFRKNRRHLEGRTDITGLCPADPESDPSQQAEQRELVMKVEAIIRELDEPNRTAFSLYYLAGQSIEETADILEVSANAVRCRLHKSRKRVIHEAKKRGVL